MYKIKLLFLDFDGVLNHDQYYKKRDLKTTPPYPLSEIDPVCIERLNEICNKSGAKIVISSSWRHGRTIEELQNILKEASFKGEVIDLTPSLSLHHKCICRGNEILKWMQDKEEMIGQHISIYGSNSEFKHYVIFDDDTDFLMSQKNNFIHIDRNFGITEENVKQALQILNL